MDGTSLLDGEQAIGPLVPKAALAELQAEPWATNGRTLDKIPLEEQTAHFGLAELKSITQFAERTGIEDIYLWGPEWLYWRKQNGEHELPPSITGPAVTTFHLKPARPPAPVHTIVRPRRALHGRERDAKADLLEVSGDGQIHHLK